MRYGTVWLHLHRAVCISVDLLWADSMLATWSDDMADEHLHITINLGSRSEVVQ
jgi:hypothetical protein